MFFHFFLKKEAISYDVLFYYFYYGIRGGIRTPDRRLRRPLLYPAELLGHNDEFYTLGTFLIFIKFYFNHLILYVI